MENPKDRMEMLIDLLYARHLGACELKISAEHYKHLLECRHREYRKLQERLQDLSENDPKLEHGEIPTQMLLWTPGQLARFAAKIQQRIKELRENESNRSGNSE